MKRALLVAALTLAGCMEPGDTTGRGAALSGSMAGPLITLQVPHSNPGAEYSAWTCMTTGFSAPPERRAADAQVAFRERISGKDLATVARENAQMKQDFVETYGCEFRYTEYYPTKEYIFQDPDNPELKETYFCYVWENEAETALRAQKAFAYEQSEDARLDRLLQNVRSGTPEWKATFDQWFQNMYQTRKTRFGC